MAIASLTLTACKKEPVKEPTSETITEEKGEWDDFFFEFEDGSVHTHAPGDGSHVGISH